jgi:hypothetical protein
MITELFIKLRTPEDIKEAIDIIKRSPELTFSILKFINSAFFPDTLKGLICGSSCDPSWI